MHPCVHMQMRAHRRLDPSLDGQEELSIICPLPLVIHIESKSQMERVATICSPGIQLLNESGSLA